MNKHLALAIAAALTTAYAGAATAASFEALDARALGMAGTGVASALPHQAALYNPALLATQPKQRFGLLLPAGARAADPDDLIDEIDAFQDAGLAEQLEQAVEAARNDPSPANAEAVRDAALALREGLQRLDNRALIGQAHGGAGFVFPSPRLGVAVHAHAWGSGGGLLSISEQDLALMDEYIEYEEGDPDPPQPFDADTSLTSSVLLRGALITETSVSLARAFPVAGRTLAIGVTPKHQRIRTVDYSFRVQDEEGEISLSDGERTYSHFNADLGIAQELGGGFMLGAVVKNMLSQRYETVEGNEIALDPQARIGLAHRTGRTTIALDVDLTENDPLGYDERTRYAALGAEINIWNTVQLRGGYRRNLLSNDTAATDIYSAGIGFSPFGMLIDVGVARNDNDVAAAINLGFRF